jgi:BioD-like phosphotransacetylase family protein
MIPIYIASTTGYSGKTFIALGLAMKLKEEGYSVGFMKPIGKTPVRIGKDLFDADAVFIKEALGLSEPLEVISPFVLTFESQALLLKGKIGDAKKQIMAAFRSLKKKDFIIIGGSGSMFEGALLNINVLSLMDDMDARVLMVEPWRGEFSADSLYGVRKLLEKRFTGAVINRVPQNTAGYVRETLRPFLEKKGVRIFGVVPKDRFLSSISVRQLAEILNGRVLCCDNALDEFVENFSIGAMDVDSALAYFRRTPNKAVITGAHRSDIQFAAMETSTKCIILTGGLPTNDVVIGRAQAKGIPIISVEDDTFTAVDKIESALGKTRIREKGKIERAKEIMDVEFDMKRFLKSLK